MILSRDTKISISEACALKITFNEFQLFPSNAYYGLEDLYFYYEEV